MISQTVWGPLEVEAFFKDFNWSGEAINLEPLASETETQAADSWLCWTVEDFIHQSNWRGQAIVKSRDISEEEIPSLSLTMSVGEFFQFAQWRNSRPMAVIAKNNHQEKPESVPAESPEMNLTDLSDLF